MDLEAKAEFWNRGATETYGYTAAEGLGKRKHEINRDTTAQKEAYERLAVLLDRERLGRLGFRARVMGSRATAALRSR